VAFSEWKQRYDILSPCKESDARSLRGGGGELGNVKTLTYGFTTFSQSKLEHTI
jgi:hypothetical protein